MIETPDEAVTYLEMVARRESGDLAEAALIVTRTLRQATQTLTDHAQASGVREGDGAGVSDEALRRMAEEWVIAQVLPMATPADVEETRTKSRFWLAQHERRIVETCDRFRRVATEAARLERERIEGIVRGFAHNEHEVPTNHVVLEILGHIEGGKR